MKNLKDYTDTDKNLWLMNGDSAERLKELDSPDLRQTRQGMSVFEMGLARGKRAIRSGRAKMNPMCRDLYLNLCDIPGYVSYVKRYYSPNDAYLPEDEAEIMPVSLRCHKGDEMKELDVVVLKALLIEADQHLS